MRNLIITLTVLFLIAISWLAIAYILIAVKPPENSAYASITLLGFVYIFSTLLIAITPEFTEEQP
ncbi:MAG: hypothetical protein NT086_19715 [Proteobacteria bacterium]|nr:hypothetical protein [Pseudomonadota bacterium]